CAEKQWPAIERTLQDLGIAYSIHYTTRRGHVTELVYEALRKGYTHLLGMGGDGTNHEIVNGIMTHAQGRTHDVHYALLPIGTGNDWARMYDLPADPAQRLRRLLQPQTVLQDIGLVRYHAEGEMRERYFVNVAGMAYDGYIGQQLQAHPVTNRVHYLLSVVKYLFQYQLSKARIEFDGHTAEDLFYTINIGLCKYSGGGMQLVPQAIGDDGLFALTFARSLSKWEVLLQTRRFYDGSLLRHPRVEGHQARSIRVLHTEERPTLLEADGEFLGHTPAEFHLLEKALRVVI
ncbi:MAG TPA: diacylglycerol kinase family lipid kinase, partial [Saprospiraceae bacterium]|nr:diacylglycerol kinase family lipid kinase [Saprospiraceae bacterium]